MESKSVTSHHVSCQTILMVQEEKIMSPETFTINSDDFESTRYKGHSVTSGRSKNSKIISFNCRTRFVRCYL